MRNIIFWGLYWGYPYVGKLPSVILRVLRPREDCLGGGAERFSGFKAKDLGKAVGNAQGI